MPLYNGNYVRRKLFSPFSYGRGKKEKKRINLKSNGGIYGKIKIVKLRGRITAGVPRSGIPFAGQCLEGMYQVYILESLKKKIYYIGHAAVAEVRLVDHNNGRVKSTKGYLPWKIVHLEKYETKSEAQTREYEIKSYKSGVKFKKLLNLPI